MRRVTRTIAAAGAAIVCCVTMTACSSPFGLPISGSVQTLAPVEQQTQRVYTNPQGPADDAQPETIVKGFYDAMPAGVQSDGYRVAREFLTGSASAGWNGDSSALVYSGTPDFRRRANTMSTPQGAESSLIVEERVAIARALVNNPAVILADEATGNLDTRTSFEILVLFQKLHAEGRTIIFVTHNPEIAQYSSRNIVLRDGQVKDDSVNPNILSAAEALAALPVQEE